MPTTVEKLSANFLRLRTKKPGKYGDGNNLWLIVGPTGRERWEFRFTRNGKSHEMSLGPADTGPGAADRTPDGLTVHDARERARQLRRELRQGIDPLADRAKPKAARASTFAEVAEQCIASLRAGWSNDKSEKQWRSTLKTYANPKIGALDVSEIVTADIFAVLEPIWTKKAETAKRTRERMEKVLDFATAMNLRSGDNPARWRGNLDHLFPKAAKVQKVRHTRPCPMRSFRASSLPCASERGSRPARWNSRS
ncbi:MAG: Arm DNA-binding domain-containing protein [Pseudomonadota bacterium]|nr:Arm DNA-binding domain-containing protein [Pseudomonadota bacterium]